MQPAEYHIRDCKHLLLEIDRVAITDYEKVIRKLTRNKFKLQVARDRAERERDELFDFFIFRYGFDRAWKLSERIETHVSSQLDKSRKSPILQMQEVHRNRKER